MKSRPPRCFLRFPIRRTRWRRKPRACPLQLSPLSNKGLLSQQVRDALKALLRDNHGAQIVKLRAFVAGSGDLRRVQTIMVEEFTERKLTLPALSTIQVGALPLTGAQVVIEATQVERREVNPGGLVFLAGFATKDIADWESSSCRIARRNVEVLRVTCYSELTGRLFVHTGGCRSRISWRGA